MVSLGAIVSISLCLALSAAAPSSPNAESHPEAEAAHPAEGAAVKRDAYNYNQRYACLVNGYRFAHGQVFSIPGYSHCLRYRCNNGGWSIYEEACEVDGHCHGVGSIFERNCVTYRCERSNRGHGYWYQPRELRRRCPDAQGNCRREGETFHYVINNTYYRRCQCQILHGGRVSYSCGDK